MQICLSWYTERRSGVEESVIARSQVAFGQKVGNVFTRKGIAALGAGAALVLTGITAGTASASTSVHPLTTTVTIKTVSAGHMDTTSYSGSATFQEPGGAGPVWAIDTLNEKWTITSCAANPTCTADNDGANYAAVLNVTKGSKFAEFADPGASSPTPGNPNPTDPCPGNDPGGPHTGQGSVSGTIEYDINSSAAPDLNSVPAVQAPNTSLGTVLGQIFDNGTYSIAGGGHYNFSYSNVCGALYQQIG